MKYWPIIVASFVLILSLKNGSAGTTLQVIEKVIVRDTLKQYTGMSGENLRELTVTLSSYNPVRNQCDDTPLFGSKGDFITPGMVAVSRDLKHKYGLKEGSKILIEGMGIFVVKDVMNKRWKKRIDIASSLPEWSREFGIRKNEKIYF